VESIFSFDTITKLELVRSESEIIGDELTAKVSERDTLAASIAVKEDRAKEINAEIKRIREEMQAKIDALATERGEIDEELWDVRRTIRELGIEILNLERRLRLALDRERQKADWERRRLEFDNLSTGYYWHEFILKHQIEGALALSNVKRGILADKMRLGKTLTVLATADLLHAQKILIIAPADVCKTFYAQVTRWAPHRNNILMYKMTRGMRDVTFMTLKRLAEYTVVINYEAWRKDPHLLDLLAECRFDTVIMDEAHAIKDTDTSAFKGVKKIVFAENSCPRCSGIFTQFNISRFEHYWQCDSCGFDTRRDKYEAYARCSVKNVFPMTGTPILNRPVEMFPLLHLVLPEIFHDKNVFLSMYCRRNVYTNRWEFRSGALDELQHHLAGRYIARDRKSAGVEIPKQDIIYHDIDRQDLVDDYPNQWRIIQQVSKFAQIILETTGAKMEMLAAITVILRKRQANVWPAGINMKDEKGDVVFSVGDDTRESIIVDRAVDLLKEICQDGMENGERAVVFSQFKGPLRELESRLCKDGIPAVVFDGDTPEYLRDQIKLDFDGSRDNPRPRWQVVLANYKTGGVGLELSGANHVISLDREWNPGKNEQAWARVESFSKLDTTTVHILRIPGTIDTWMDNLNDEKAGIVEGVESMASNLLEAMRNGEIA